MRLFLLFLFSLLLVSCEMFEYNPNDYELEEWEKGSTAKNLSRLGRQQPGDTVLMILTGDTQRFYDETKALVEKVNSRPPGDFVIICGDISDFGLPAEFRWMQNIYSSLNAPYLTVIGNHDLLANGRQIYLDMFGLLDYSFTYGRYHFVMVNTNGLEYGFNGTVPDTNFLRQQLLNTNDSLQKILVSHVRPVDTDFDPALNAPLGKIISNTVYFVGGFHGHNHVTFVSYPYGLEYPFVTPNAANNGSYLEVRFYRSQGNLKDTFDIKEIFY